MYPMLDEERSGNTVEHNKMKIFSASLVTMINDEHDILFTLKVVFKETEASATLLSYVRQDTLTANHLCTVLMNQLPAGQDFSCPVMKPPDAKVTRNFK